MPEIKNELEVEVLLEILDKTTRAYMGAFELERGSIELTSIMQKKYHAFKEIDAYYMDEKDECASYVIFSFDWERYEMQCQSDDPDIIISRNSINTMTPERILEDACNVISSRIKTVKRKRHIKYIRMVYTYSDSVRENIDLIDRIRKEANLVPFDKQSIVYSDRIKGYKTSIKSSESENTLAIDFIV